jgi:hypothetical protein
MNTELSVRYADAETRGKLRMWKKKLAADYVTFDNALRELGQSRHLPIDMIKSTRSGRKLAFAKINRMFGPGVTLETADLGRRNQSLAIWSILKPRTSVAAAVPDDVPESERASLAQDCVCVHHVLVGCVDEIIQVMEGMWTLEVPDHALGRAVERSRFLHPGTLIREAHLTLLALPDTVLKQGGLMSGAYIKAGAGCFAGQFHVGPDVSLGICGAFVRARTWLDEDQLSKQQIVLCEKGEPGKQLGDSWLKPAPLRRIERSGSGEVHVRVWRPELSTWRPASLAVPPPLRPGLASASAPPALDRWSSTGALCRLCNVG